jgi:hypothetical protein
MAAAEAGPRSIDGSNFLELKDDAPIGLGNSRKRETEEAGIL